MKIKNYKQYTQVIYFSPYHIGTSMRIIVPTLRGKPIIQEGDKRFLKNKKREIKKKYASCIEYRAIF